MGKTYIKKLAVCSLFLCLGLVLPFITGQIKQLSNIFLPMHLPMMLCGLVCGAPYGFIAGAVCPLLRSFLFGMPYLYPNAIAMSFELCIYGGLSGFVYSKRKQKNTLSVFVSIIPAMIFGRIAFGVVKAILLMFSQNDSYSFFAFVSGSVVSGLPGIALQLVIIPLIMSFLNKSDLMKF